MVENIDVKMQFSNALASAWEYTKDNLRKKGFSQDNNVYESLA